MSANETAPREVLCIGSVLWDTVGRAPTKMSVGSDVPGRITRVPGGVALNIAVALRRAGFTPKVLSFLGLDADGDALVSACNDMGLETSHIMRSADHPTDSYMAIEGANGVIAAIADAHSLEAVGDLILKPLVDGTLGSETAPYSGQIALDGNLTDDLLSEIAGSPLFARSDLRVAPASPGKAIRLTPFLNCPHATLYVNLEEARIMLGHAHDTARQAGVALVDRGATRVLVTHGNRPAADCTVSNTYEATPPEVQVKRVTGAGDTFMAAHMAAEARGETRENALQSALDTAAQFVAGADP